MSLQPSDSRGYTAELQAAAAIPALASQLSPLLHPSDPHSCVPAIPAPASQRSSLLRPSDPRSCVPAILAFAPQQ